MEFLRFFRDNRPGISDSSLEAVFAAIPGWGAAGFLSCGNRRRWNERNWASAVGATGDQMEASDQELLRAVGRGSSDAFVELVRRHQRLVRWRLARMVPADQVDDLAQEVFLELSSQATRLAAAGIRSLSAWLLQLARNKAVDYLRVANRQQAQLLGYCQSQSRLDRATATLGSDDLLAAGEILAMRHCLQKLQPKYREVLDGYYEQGKSAELIGIQTGRTAGAVRMILMRIRRALAKCIRQQMSRESGSWNDLEGGAWR